MKTPVRGQAQPGQDNRDATAARTPNLSHPKPNAKRTGLYQIRPKFGGDVFTISVKGRDAWALDRLIEAGNMGCTPITQPAPRWSAYVHKLRERGVPIETIHEPHDGEFPGTHGRYILRAFVAQIGGGQK
jgi:hypothetical protein